MTTVPLGLLATCHDELRIPLNAGQRADRQGPYPYWGANSVQDHIDGYTVEGPTVLLGEDGAPFLDPAKDVAFYVNERIWPNNHVHVLKANDGVDPAWLAYALNVVDYSLYIRGSTRSKLNQQEMLTIRLPHTGYRTQRRIADYLDRETAEIDAMDADLDRLIEVLGERLKRYLVGLAEELHLGPGKKAISLGYLLTKQDRTAEAADGVVTAFRDGEVTLRSRRREDGFTNSQAFSGYQGVEPGDLVFHGLDGFAGAVGVSDSRGKVSPVYHVCRATKWTTERFATWALRALATAGHLEAHAWSVRQRSVDFRNWATFAGLRVAYVEPDRQHQIADHLDKETAEINSMIEDAKRLKDVLAERRMVLISDVVTGRKEVPA